MSCHPFFYETWSEITKGYGWLEYDPESEAYHPGFDYNDNDGKGGNGDLDKPIHACKRGIARYAQDSKGGYGLLTVLEHEDGTYSKYAHQNKILVKVGQMVEEGEIIGLAGKSGTSSVHCHHELLTNKLVEYLKKTNPKKWFTFYPKGKSKAWVAENYINPLTAHTYPPPAEIKKNMNIRILLLIDDKIPYSLDTLRSRIASVREFWTKTSDNRLNYQFDIEQAKFGDPKWTPLSPEQMCSIQNTWSGFYLVPYASGYDVIVVWVHPDKWKSPGSLAYSSYEQLLGVHFIATMVPENYTDSRWKGRYDGSPFAGVLSHESGHMLNQRTTSGRKLNNGTTHQPGQDNTHYFDLVVKDLAPMFAEIPIEQFKGWKPQEGYKRMFAYGNRPSGKKWEFSGDPEVGKVYRSSDWRMFFRYTGAGLKWEPITETEFKTAVKAEVPHGEMAVQEANKIQIDILGLPTPDYIPNMIKDRLVQTGSWEEKWLKLMGWSETIPTKHLQ